MLQWNSDCVLNIILLLICLLVIRGSVIKGEIYSDSCRFALVAHSLEIDTSEGPVLELHIRQNIKGTLEVRDGDFGDSKLRLDIEKSAPTDEALKFITVNHTIFNIEKGNVYVLQIDYKEVESSVIAVVIGAFIATSLVIALCFAVGLWYCRRRERRHFSPRRRLHGIPQHVFTQGLGKSSTVESCTLGDHEGDSVRQNTGTIDSRITCTDIPLTITSSYNRDTQDGASLKTTQTPNGGLVLLAGNIIARNSADAAATKTKVLVHEDSIESPRSFFPRCYDNEVVTPCTPTPDTALTTQPLPPALTPTGSSNYEPLQRVSGREECVRRRVASPTPLSKTTVAMFTIVTALSLVYASCPTIPQANIILSVPPAVKLATLRLFYAEKNTNLVLTDRWMLKNFTNLKVFDLSSAEPVTSLPCFPREVCPSAYRQNLAGCDARDRTCVCTRGYTLYQDVCIDVNECASGSHGCPSAARCVNTIGSYLCHCGAGYFGSMKQCQKRCPKSFPRKQVTWSSIQRTYFFKYSLSYCNFLKKEGIKFEPKMSGCQHPW